MKNSTLANLGLAVVLATSFGACAADEMAPADDELASETAQDGEEAKADAKFDNFNYLALHANAPSPCNLGHSTCSTYTLNRVNRTTTICADKRAHADCTVATIVWDKLGLSAAKVAQLEKALAAELADPSIDTQIIVKGAYKSYVDFMAFEVSEAWVAQIEGGVVDGPVVRISPNGTHCGRGPCAATLEGRLNSNLTANIWGLDFDGNADADLRSAVYAAEGVKGAIVAGSRVTMGRATYRTVNQVFLPAK
jgi:hypothetical protein